MLIIIIKKIPKLIKDLFILTIQFIQSLYYKDKKKYKDAWLFCERGIDAGDNAYWMFKYIRENHKEINAYYIIDSKNQKDYKKVKEIGNTIEFNSFEHKMAFMLSKVYLCTHYGYITKCNYNLYKKTFGKNKKYIFLQHGIISNDLSHSVNKLIAPFDIFITSTKKEYQEVITNHNYGYKDEVKLTGLARFDNLNNNKIRKQILFMPSWRNYLASLDGKIDNNKFLQSQYYIKIMELLKNEELSKILSEQGLKFIFYPHHEIQRYIELFKVNNKNIIIAKESEYSIQNLLKESAFLITDYSSIHFDFAYLKKPLIYYQFDKEDFYHFHYKAGYFDYSRDGFGPVYTTLEDVIKYLNKKSKQLDMDKKYIKRVEHTFHYIDDKNCERIYKEIEKIIK